MKQILRTIAATLVLLFSMNGAQAATVPIVPVNQVFPNLEIGNSYSIEGVLPDQDLNVAWFQFTLSGLGPDLANVYLDTGNTAEFTILALWDADVDGTLLGQNDACPADFFVSCLSRNLGDGTYIAGVTLFTYSSIADPFDDGWMLKPGEIIKPAGDDAVTLNITVSPVPVPAAFWLFGTALLGFVGMSRRTSVKS